MSDIEKKRVNLTVRKDTYDSVLAIAEGYGMSVTALLNMIINQYVQGVRNVNKYMYEDGGVVNLAEALKR